MQSSINDIASLYRGNPAQLQQRVQKDMQASPKGIPQDLKELLALQILTEEQSSVDRQKAIDALQQTQGEPTVAQSMQQRAQQAIQARQVQQQRQQQGIQQLAQRAPQGGIPENVPQPEQQPQQESMAFAEGGYAGAGRGVQGGPTAEELEQYLREEEEKKKAESRAAQAKAQREEGDIPEEVKRRSLEIANANKKPPAKPAPAGVPAALNNTDTYKKMAGIASEDPEIAAQSAIDRYKTEVGAPDVSGLQEYVKELEAKRARQKEAIAKEDPLIEYLAAIGSAPRGSKWYEAVLHGSDTLKKRAAERETADTEAIRQILEQKGKIADINRGFRKETFTVGNEERNRVAKDAFDAAKEMGANDREAYRIAQNAVIERERIAASKMHVPGAAENITNRVIALRSKGKGKEADQLLETYLQASAGSAGSGQLRANVTGLSTLLTNLRKQREDATEPAEIAMLDQQIRNATSQLQELLKAEGGGAAPANGAKSGATPALPPGFKLD